MTLQEELGLDLPFKDLRHEAVINIVRTATVLASAGDSLFRRFDMTEAQFNILFLLKYKENPVTQADLGRRLVVTRASITSVLDRLEAKGLVQRLNVAGNRRIHHDELTKEGERLLDRIEPEYRLGLREATADLSEAECRQLTRLLERLRATAGDVRDELAGDLPG